MITHFKNGRCYTLHDENAFVNELYTEDGRILALGPQTINPDRVIDLKGGVLFPGFVDAHLHLAGYGERLTLSNLQKEPSLQRILEKLQTWFVNQPLYVQGYQEVGLTAHHLDTLSTTEPILIRHADYHSATVNSYLLNKLGIKQSNGVLHELDAQRAVFAMPRHSNAMLITMIENAISALHQFGITGGHSDDLHYFNGFVDTVAAFEHALQNKPFRAHLLMHHEEVSGYVKSQRPWLDQSSYLQLGAVKIFYDGTLSSQTAWMKHPYPHSTSHYGERIMAPNDFETTLQRMRALNLPVALHTIGDAALDEVADYLIKYPVKKGLHDRIIHASFALPSTLSKLKQIPVILDIQPQFLSSDLPWGLELLPKGTQLIYPWATYQRAGLTLCGGSDAPVEIPDPLFGIKASVFRLSDHDGKSYGEDERLSMYEAILLYTQWANVPTYKSHERGKLEVGYIADFTVFNCDFLAQPQLIHDARVTHTIVDDHLVYQHE